MQLQVVQYQQYRAMTIKEIVNDPAISYAVRITANGKLVSFKDSTYNGLFSLAKSLGFSDKCAKCNRNVYRFLVQKMDDYIRKEADKEAKKKEAAVVDETQE